MPKRDRRHKEGTPDASQADAVPTDKPPRHLSWIKFILLSLPIIAYGMRILATGDLLGLEDWDWFFSHYEAVRRSIVDYGQFPWWNPWSAGGAPLFADPQIGLVSIQMPLVLAFGTVLGLKIGVVIYLLAGFWGMFFLLSLLNSGGNGVTFWRKTLLSYLWISSTFVMFHYTAGHYTFLLYLLVPWLVYLYLRWNRAMEREQGGRQVRNSLICFTLFAGFFINSAPHYIALQTIIWMVGLFLVLAHRNRNRLPSFALWHAVALLLILPLIAPKVIFALQYLGDFPRAVLHNPSIGMVESVKAVALPAQPYSHVTNVPKLGSWEISAYVGVLTMLLFLGMLGWFAAHWIRTKENREPLFIAIAAMAALAFIIGLGPFAPMSPWSIMSSLPVLESLQVPSRWFGWTVFFVVLAIGSVRNFPKWALILLAVSLVELTAFNIIREQPFMIVKRENAAPSAEVFEQFDVYPKTKDLRYTTMFMAMSQNFGEVRAYEPLLGNDPLHRKTARRGINDGYTLVSPNARLIEWSPNKIRLKRIGPGPMILNANVGCWWTLNDRYSFSKMRVTEPTVQFALDENAPHQVTLECKPLNAWLLYLPMLTLVGYLVIIFRSGGTQPPRSATGQAFDTRKPSLTRHNK